MLRCAAILLIGLAVTGCVSVHEDPGLPITDAASTTTVMAEPAARPGLEVCELVGRDSILKVLTTREGTRYTLCTRDGFPVAEGLDAHELARLRPDLDPESMQADWGRGPLMYVDRVD